MCFFDILYYISLVTEVWTSLKYKFYFLGVILCIVQCDILDAVSALIMIMCFAIWHIAESSHILESKLRITGYHLMLNTPLIWSKPSATINCVKCVHFCFCLDANFPWSFLDNFPLCQSPIHNYFMSCTCMTIDQ